MSKYTNNNKTSSKWSKKISEEVTINYFKNIIGDEEIYKQVLLIKDKLSLCESLEEQVIMLMKNIFLIY